MSECATSIYFSYLYRQNPGFSRLYKRLACLQLLVQAFNLR